VLAKHDENYLPPEAAPALEKAGQPGEPGAFAGQKGAPGCIPPFGGYGHLMVHDGLVGSLRDYAGFDSGRVARARSRLLLSPPRRLPASAHGVAPQRRS